MDNIGNTDTYLKKYQAWVESVSTDRVNSLGLTYAGLGLAGETGEVVEKIKKIVRDNREPNHDDTLYLMLELGDVVWYVSKIANSLGLSLQEILDSNMEKINNRKIYGKQDSH